MISLASALILLVLCVSLGHSLVHFIQLQSGGKKGGCIGKSGKPIPVGGWEKDPNTCGVYVCQNNEGVALIHYCQSPPPFQECDDDGVSTVLPFPECCWICVDYADCDGDGEHEDEEEDEDNHRRVKPGSEGAGDAPKEETKKGAGDDKKAGGDESTQKSADESTQKSEDNSQQKSGEESKGSEAAATDGTGGENKEKSNEANANKSKQKYKFKIY